MEQLIDSLTQRGLIDPQGNIVLEVYENGSYQSVDKDTFLGFFGETDFSYGQLVQADNEKGYTRFFNEWKDVGIL